MKPAITKCRKVLPGAILVLAPFFPHAGYAEQGVRFVATEFSFDKEVLRASPEEPITLLLQNNGAVAHNLAIPALDVSTDTIGSDEEDRIEFSAPQSPGDYRIICTVPGHAQAGMTATLKIE